MICILFHHEQIAYECKARRFNNKTIKTYFLIVFCFHESDIVFHVQHERDYIFYSLLAFPRLISCSQTTGTLNFSTIKSSLPITLREISNQFW